jgi:hypothetical protein
MLGRVCLRKPYGITNTVARSRSIMSLGVLTISEPGTDAVFVAMEQVHQRYERLAGIQDSSSTPRPSAIRLT